MNKIKKFFSILGPGFITGASDDDPSGIATYAQAGARFGYSQLWTALFLFPFMALIQEMCGRIGLVTGKGLAGVLRVHYPKWVLFGAVTLLVIANTINIGADLGAMAASGQLVLGIPFMFWLFGITIGTLCLEIFVSYPVYARFLKYLTLSLLSYVVVVVMVKQSWSSIAIATLIPSFSLQKEYLISLVALLGTTLSPYLFFWQASQEVEETRDHRGSKVFGLSASAIARKEITQMRLDTILGMLFSNLIMFFIIATTASTLHVNGIFDIKTADQVAMALRPIVGDFAYLLFAVGIVGTGLLAVPILAGSASYAVSESLRWNWGLSKKFNQAHGFYAIIIIATVIGLLVNFIPIQPFQMLYYAAILNGICAPPLILLILLVANNKKIMGEKTNSKTLNILGVIILLVMSIASLLLLFSFV